MSVIAFLPTDPLSVFSRQKRTLSEPWELKAHWHLMGSGEASVSVSLQTS